VTAEHGFSVRWKDAEGAVFGCICPEEFDHDGKCPNPLRTKKEAKCPPCSQDWHHEYPCKAYLSKGFTIASTQCDTCGFDSAEHQLTDHQRAIMVDARAYRRSQH
jgi:hypothetical protein